MANPTQQPPEFVPANFSQPGPFAQYLQVPAQAQTQELQNQGQHFSGREGALGVGAGLLTNWINGASSGRARALAQRHEQEMQNAQKLNQYKQMVAESDRLPEDKERLIAEATKLEHRVVNDHVVESGKSNPLMKALGVVHQTLMGGPPVDQIYDPVQKKMIKREIGVIHPQEMQGLYDAFHKTPTEGTKRTQASQNMYELVSTAAAEAKAVKEAGGDFTPLTGQDLLGHKPDLWRLSNEFEEKYKFPSPMSAYMRNMAPPMDPLKAVEYNAMRNALDPRNPNNMAGQGEVKLQGGIPGMPNEGMASGTETMPQIAASGKQYQHTATNAAGHVIGSDDGQTWLDLKTGQPLK